MRNDEIYVSTDVETDGPIPGPNSMLSIGSAVFRDGHFVDAFSANLLPLDGAQPDPATAAWWQQRPDAYAAATDGARPAEVVMNEYRRWVASLCESQAVRPVFVAYPAGFDFLFVYWYLVRFTGGSPFSFSALDMKSFAMAKLGLPYRESTKGGWPHRWRKPAGRTAEHTHVALDDAIEQGYQFMAMLNDRR